MLRINTTYIYLQYINALNPIHLSNFSAVSSIQLKDSLQHETDPDSQINGTSLRSDVWISLQTRYAQLLVRGRVTKGKPPIVGLIRFADMLRIIWYAAQANDPYADWWLIKIHDALSSFDKRIEKERKHLQELLSAREGFRIVPAHLRDPFRVNLRFSSPYAYRAAQALVQFDGFVRDSLAAEHVGILPRRTAQDGIHSVATKLRSLFHIPCRYRHLGIDRANPVSFDGDGETAKRFMGEIPPDILNGTRRAAFAPPINKNAREFLPPILENELDELRA